MSDLRRTIDEIPVTLVTAIAYVTLLVVTDPFREPEHYHERLHAFGTLTPELAANGQAWRLLASAYLHIGVVHLLMNLSGLFAFGPALERSLGSVRFLVLYVVAALGGSLLVCVVYEPNQGVAGGSGALFGLMGAILAMNMRSGRHLFAFLAYEGPRRMIGSIVVWLLLGATPLLPVSNTGHIGGLLAGFAVTFLWLVPGPTSRARTAWRAATAALLASLLLWSLFPVTRVDWLIRESEATNDPQRRAALLQAGYLADPRWFEPMPREEDEPQRPR